MRVVLQVTMIAVLLSPSVGVSQTTLPCPFLENETLLLSDSPYLLECNLELENVIIEPGVRIEASGDFEIKVLGGLRAVGTQSQRIVFTTTDDSTKWQGIYFSGRTAESELTHCLVENSINSGIRINEASPIIRHCEIARNQARYGAGINISGSLPVTLEDCSISENFYSGANPKGGGIYTTSPLVLIRCKVQNNEIRDRPCSFGRNATTFGGGVYAESTVALYNVVLTGNIASACGGAEKSWGGGVYADGDLVAHNCTIANNTAGAGGINAGGGARGYGGGISCGSTVELKNCIIANNATRGNSQGYGGGIYATDGSIENCTIVCNNRPGVDFGGSILNSILWGNTESQFRGGASVTFSCVQDIAAGDGNISDDPMLPACDPAIPENLKIPCSSPCVDAGNPDPQYDDASFPPLCVPCGTTRNDMGAHGGPGGCGFAPSLSSPVRSGTITVGDALRFSAEGPAGQYMWNFGDGRTSLLRSPGLLAFHTEGEFEVVLIVGDPLGEHYRGTRRITVIPDSGDIPDLDVISVNVPPELALGQAVDITYSVRNLGGGALTEAAWADAIYVSRDQYLDTGDTHLASVPVARELGVGQTYQGTITVTLPPTLEEGAYHLIVSVDDEWEILEHRQLNNEFAVATDLAIPLLEDGVDHTAPFAAGLVTHYYRINAPAGGRSLLLSLDPSVAGLQVFARFGTLPTRGTHDYQMQNNQLLIPAATTGTWYIFVYGDAMDQAGQYTIGYESVGLRLLDVSPRHHGTAGPLELTLTGTGFYLPMQVALVGADDTPYFASDVEVNSFTRITATFATGAVPAGIYSVRVARPKDESDELPGIFEMIAGGESNLEINLIMPASFGYHALATVYVEYINTGDVAMPAPILVTTVTQNDRQAAILTLDKTRVSQGLWTSVMPEGFANSVQFLASGEIAGILQPGESQRVPVYYVGWQKPWDFSYPPFIWTVGVLDANNDVPVDWAAMKADMRPSNVREDAWNVVWSNFTTQAGATWGDYVAMLSRYALYLDRLGQRVEDVTQLLAFAFRQADALSPLPVLAGGADAAVQAPGLPIVLRRLHAQPISRRFELGPLGRGWTHNWQYTLEVREDGTVAITVTGTPRIFQPDVRPGRPYLASPWDRGVLRAVGEGRFSLTESNGLVRSFSATGKLEYVEDTNGNRITCTYTDELLTHLTHSAGAGLAIAYNGGLISSVTDDHGRQTQYTYNSEHIVSIQAYDGQITTYTYDTTAGAPTQHALVEIGLPNGVRRTFTYDARGRLAATARNGNAEPIAFSYGSEGQMTAIDALGNASRFFVGYAGRIVKVENPLGSAVHFDFDELLQLVAVTDPAGLAWTFDYDNRGNLTLFTDALRQSTLFTYTPTYNRLALMIDANGNRTTYNRDLQGNLAAITYADGSTETWSYDAQGNPNAWANRRGDPIAYAYDAAGRVTSKT